MEGDLSLTGLNVERRIPGAPSWAIKAIELARPKIGKCGIDEVCMRGTCDQFIGWQGLGAMAKSSEPSAGRSFDFSKVVLVLRAGELQEHGIAQARRRHKPHGPFQRNTQNRKGHLSQTATQGIDIAPDFNHHRDAALNHGLNGRSIREERPGVRQLHPAIRHCIGEQQMEALEDPYQGRRARELILRKRLAAGVTFYAVPRTRGYAEKGRRFISRNVPSLRKIADGLKRRRRQALTIFLIGERLPGTGIAREGGIVRC
jgi:hypothetical protein